MACLAATVRTDVGMGASLEGGHVERPACRKWNAEPASPEHAGGAAFPNPSSSDLHAPVAFQSLANGPDSARPGIPPRGGGRLTAHRPEICAPPKPLLR